MCPEHNVGRKQGVVNNIGWGEVQEILACVLKDA